MEDPRFRRIASDPRFKSVPRKRRKVTVDSRFKSMFTDDRFKVNYNIDKRGSKAILQTSSEDLKKYYAINSSEDEGVAESVAAESNELDGEDEDGENSAQEIDNEVDSEKEGMEEEEDEEVDYDNLNEAGTDIEEEEVDSDSSTDIEDEESLKALAANGVFSNWLDQIDSIEKSDDSGYRLALCNMNWDRIGAIDLYVLFNSFRPPGGVVKYVSIYLSDFGRERLKEEELKGPQELIQDTPQDEEDPNNYKDSNVSGDKLREYQLKRLQYYYAVIECDCHATAEHIYKECDGLEFELTSSCLDLRFIPDDMSFSKHKPTSVATESSLTKDYQPPEFMTTALQQSNVRLTWDETHPSRLKTTMKNYNKSNISEANFDDLLGSSSEDEAESTETGGESVKKYRSLLGLSGHANKETEKGEELEITWNIGLEEDESSQNFKSKKKAGKRTNISKEDKKGDKGFDDPFFTQPSSQKRKRKLTREEEDQIQKEKDDLELLVLSDTEDTREHFSLAGIMKEEKKASAKKKRRERKDKNGTKESSSTVSDFQLDLNDPRFSALYTSHHYAIEPSNHQYKPTKGMKSLLQERQKRRREKNEEEQQSSTDVHSSILASTGISSSSLEMLVKSVKAKAHKNSSKKLQKISLR